ncbi:hypothetical protein AB0M64_15265 [Streptomyces sp. NPDC051771]|uniref:hypothetical protein n=1 Tax=Streptomyces sp. NPDC051771 TaxID=3154847 RepID=UPI00341DC48D
MTKPASEAALPETMRREGSGLPPAKAEKQGKTGGRDAAIWLSAVAYASNNPEESASFVSSRPAYQGGALDATEGARAVETAHHQVRALPEIERRLLLNPWERELRS